MIGGIAYLVFGLRLVDLVQIIWTIVLDEGCNWLIFIFTSFLVCKDGFVLLSILLGKVTSVGCEPVSKREMESQSFELLVVNLSLLVKICLSYTFFEFIRVLQNGLARLHCD